MIYVQRDPNLIPEKLLRVAERAQQKLEELPADQRVEFIKKKSHIWRSFARHLRQMSYGKCWYSEADDPQSFFDVDHFRPKSEARRSDQIVDEGYPWLAFSWDNFRYAAQRSNRLSTDEETDETVGKGSWFPLIEGSRVACWNDRCEAEEQPVLLDPTNPDDVALVGVDETGAVCPSRFCVGSGVQRVERSIELYGLNLPRLTEARRRVMRGVGEQYELLMQHLTAAKEHPQAADKLAIDTQVASLRSATLPRNRFSRAARAQLSLMPHGLELCALPEDLVEDAAA